MNYVDIIGKVVCCFLAAGVGTFIMYILYKWINSKKKFPTETKEEEPPKPTTRKAIMEITLINNKTDKEYVVKSENDFGLTWKYFDAKQGHWDLLHINQYNSTDEETWTAISRFTDFSVKSTVWKEFDIVTEEKNKTEEVNMWAKEYNPSVGNWYIVIVDGKRFPALYNDDNIFWCGQDGKTYKPNQIEMWLDDSKIEKK